MSIPLDDARARRQAKSARCRCRREVRIEGDCCGGVGGLLWDDEGDVCSSGSCCQAVRDIDIGEANGNQRDPVHRSSSLARPGRIVEGEGVDARL